MLITAAWASIAAWMHWITSAIVRSVPIDSTGAPGYMPTMPTPFARPAITLATAVPWRSSTVVLRMTCTPARSGTVVSAAPSITAVSGAWLTGGGSMPGGTRTARQSVA